MADASVIGLHVHGRELRRAELVRSGSLIEIVRLESLALSAGAAGTSSGGSPALPANGTRNGSHRLIASLPAIDVMSRCWSLPGVDESKLRQMVAHRLEADLPVPLDQLEWGYRRGAAGGAEQVLAIMAQAARSERIRGCLNRLSAAGVSVQDLTTEAEGLGALYRHGLEHPADSGTEAMILADGPEWLVAVIDRGLVRCVRRLSVVDGRTEEACRTCRQIMAAETSSGGLRRVWWCGGSLDGACREALEFAAGAPVEVAQPADRLVLSGGEILDGERLARFGPAIGLALAGMFERETLIRLAGREERRAAEAAAWGGRIFGRLWFWAGAVALALVLAVVLHMWALHSETTRMNTLLASATSAESATDALRPRILAVRRLEKYRIDVESIIGEICGAIKDQITLTSIELARERRLVIKGKSQDPKAIFTFADDLRKSKLFQGVSPDRTSPGQGGDFTITAELVKVEKFSKPLAGGIR
ncbi:MAG: hypothetical protein AMXMBFR13_36570 [Phycisphaerae bacterium]